MASSAHAADALVAPPAAPSYASGAVGDWARYRAGHAGGSSAQDLRIALVGKGKGTTTWEVSMLVPENRTATVKDVVGPDGGVVARAMKVGPDAPFRLDIPPALARAAFRIARTPAGDEPVTVPAGKFNCRHLHEDLEPGHGYDLWVAAGVQPTGVVRFEEWTRGGNGVRIVQESWELLETGRGAKPVVTGPVREAPPPPRKPR